MGGVGGGVSWDGGWVEGGVYPLLVRLKQSSQWAHHKRSTTCRHTPRQEPLPLECRSIKPTAPAASLPLQCILGLSWEVNLELNTFFLSSPFIFFSPLHKQG